MRQQVDAVHKSWQTLPNFFAYSLRWMQCIVLSLTPEIGRLWRSARSARPGLGLATARPVGRGTRAKAMAAALLFPSASMGDVAVSSGSLSQRRKAPTDSDKRQKCLRRPLLALLAASEKPLARLVTKDASFATFFLRVPSAMALIFRRFFTGRDSPCRHYLQ